MSDSPDRDDAVSDIRTADLGGLRAPRSSDARSGAHALEVASRIQSSAQEPQSRHRNGIERPDEYYLYLPRAPRNWIKLGRAASAAHAPVGRINPIHRGGKKYEDLDPGWLGCFRALPGSERVYPFPSHIVKGIDP